MASSSLAPRPANSLEAIDDEPHVCLDCRTVLGPGERCDRKRRHRVVSLRDQEGREALRTEVWGPPSVRRRAKNAAKAGGTGAGLGGLDTCAGCDALGAGVEGLAVVAVVLFAGVVLMALYLLGSFLLATWRAYKNRLVPKGAMAKPAALGRGHRHEGRITSGSPLSPPAGADVPDCFGYAVELSERSALGRSKVMLREARTGGFTLALASGESLIVPSGRFRLEAPAERHRLDALALAERLASDDDTEHRLVVFDEVRQMLLRRDDRVAIFGRVEVESVAEGDAGPYRGGASRRLVATGPVDVRVLERGLTG